MLDYHIHTSMCTHAAGTMEEYVEYALSKEIREIGFSDHFPMDVLGFSNETICSMSYDDLEDYLSNIDILKEKYEGIIEIRTGIEMDYQEDLEEKLKEFTADNRWDYIIGAIHFIDGYDFSKPGQERVFKNISVDDLYIKYFEKVKNLVNSGLFDIVAHLDLIKKFGCKPKNISLEELYREIAKVVADAGVTVEVNTGGFRHPVKEMYPSNILLEKLFLEGVPFTIGSDAHKPEDVGYNFGLVLEGLQVLGINKIFGFRKRKPFLFYEMEG